MERPRTHYVRSGDGHVAYQIHGAGHHDILVAGGFASHLDAEWDWPRYRRFMERLGRLGRVIRFDRRGVGLSDPLPFDLARGIVRTLDERMGDVLAILDAAGSQRAVLFGVSEGAPISILLAATYPDRVESLILHGGMARVAGDVDYPWAAPREALIESLNDMLLAEVDESPVPETFSPSLVGDPAELAHFERIGRGSASPGMLRAVYMMALDVDVRPVLATLHLPVLVTHRSGDRVVSIHGARWMAEQIPGARFVELDGSDHFPWVGDQERVLGEIEEFLTGERHGGPVTRMLMTLLFTDIVGSTELAARLGDEEWRNLLDRHDQATRQELARYAGKERKTTGDGFLATFDGPARAVQCAVAVVEACHREGIEVRAGVHAGEVEVHGQDLAGITVHLAARVADLAQPEEVLVSRTVKDLVAGSGLTFEDRGEHSLKGVEDTWRLYAVVDRA